MKYAIPGIRPEVITEELFIFLEELMAFRYMFGHAYNYNLEPGKIQDLRKRILEGKGQITKDLDHFESNLHRLL